MAISHPLPPITPVWPQVDDRGLYAARLGKLYSAMFGRVRNGLATDLGVNPLTKVLTALRLHFVKTSSKRWTESGLLLDLETR